MPAEQCNNSSIQLTNINDEYDELELHSPVVMLSSDEVTLEESGSTISVDGPLLGLRVLNIIMSMISFSVMSRVPSIYRAYFVPPRDCGWTGGSFSYRAYHATLSVGVIVCFANIVLTLQALSYIANQSKTFQSFMKLLHATCKMTTVTAAPDVTLFY
jgi:hypothetical protein